MVLELIRWKRKRQSTRGRQYGTQARTQPNTSDTPALLAQNHVHLARVRSRGGACFRVLNGIEGKSIPSPDTRSISCACILQNCASCSLYWPPALVLGAMPTPAMPGMTPAGMPDNGGCCPTPILGVGATFFAGGPLSILVETRWTDGGRAETAVRFHWTVDEGRRGGDSVQGLGKVRGAETNMQSHKMYMISVVTKASLRHARTLTATRTPDRVRITTKHQLIFPRPRLQSLRRRASLPTRLQSIHTQEAKRTNMYVCDRLVPPSLPVSLCLCEF